MKCQSTLCKCTDPDSPVRCGERVEIEDMPNDPDPIPVGTRGTVEFANFVRFTDESFWQIGVKWDNGRSLMMVCPSDRFKKVEE